MGKSDTYRKFRKEKLKDNCIVFESFWGRRYGCNPAAFYEYINEKHPEYECVWLLNDTDVEIPGRARKVLRGTDEHRYYLATAKYFVFNNNMPRSFRKRDGQVIVHTMHGTPYKSYGLDVKEEADTEEKRLRIVERANIWDYLVAQGEFTRDMAWRWFRYDKAILQTGYPRTDALYREDVARGGETRARLGLPNDKKVILYAPTWRKMDSFSMELDLERMRRELADDYVILIRLHHFDAEYYEVPEDGEFIFDGSKVDKIEDLFPITDILITDYSSVMFDFALTDKPMIFFAYDLEDYAGSERGSYFDIATEAPGTVARSTDEVISAVRDAGSHWNLNSDRVEKFHRKYLTYENPDSCERIYDEVFVKKTHRDYIAIGDRLLTLVQRILPQRVYTRLNKAHLKLRL